MVNLKFNEELLDFVKKYCDNNVQATRTRNMIIRSMVRNKIPLNDIYDVLKLDVKDLSEHGFNRGTTKTKSRTILLNIQKELNLIRNQGAGI